MSKKLLFNNVGGIAPADVYTEVDLYFYARGTIAFLDDYKECFVDDIPVTQQTYTVEPGLHTVKFKKGINYVEQTSYCYFKKFSPATTNLDHFFLLVTLIEVYLSIFLVELTISVA